MGLRLKVRSRHHSRLSQGMASVQFLWHVVAPLLSVWLVVLKTIEEFVWLWFLWLFLLPSLGLTFRVLQ